ncbi:hypothetical protein FO519_004376 [Halicephalobus sp. NKZ332]|nr:hypothetical protein FO519_004376 [Halicephalobus sp. NKZ332]
MISLLRTIRQVSSKPRHLEIRYRSLRSGSGFRQISSLSSFDGSSNSGKNTGSNTTSKRFLFYPGIVCLTSGVLLYYINRDHFTAYAADDDAPVKKSQLREFLDEQAALLKKKLANMTLPEHVPYVIIGGGTAAYYAALTIRAFDPNAKILMISDERETPYNRPPLSKGKIPINLKNISTFSELWLYGTPTAYKTFDYMSISGKKRDIRYESDGFFLNPGALEEFEHGAVSLLRNTRAIELDPSSKEVILDSGKKVKFDKCLIATGGKPSIPYPFYTPHLRNKVMTYSTIADYQKLCHIARESESILIFGDSILAPELAFSLSSKFEKKLKIVYALAEDRPFGKIAPKSVSDPIEKVLLNSGVQIHPGSKPISVDKLPNGKVSVIFESDGKKKQIIVDYIIIADKFEPSIKIAKDAGISVDEKIGGIVADSKLQTSVEDVFVAGDVAAYEDPLFGRVRMSRWENAQITGRLAGQNMTGNIKEFHHRPSFTSTFGHEVHVSAIGKVDSSLKTVSVFAPIDKNNPTESRGVVFYVEANKVVGVLLLNVFGVGIEMARKIISDAKEVTNFKDLVKLFDLYQPQNEEEEAEKNLAMETLAEVDKVKSAVGTQIS